MIVLTICFICRPYSRLSEQAATQVPMSMHPKALLSSTRASTPALTEHDAAGKLARANLCTKDTDQFCRLPLLTLF